MAPRRTKSPKRANSRKSEEKQVGVVGHVLGQEELAARQSEKVASFAAKNFPSPVEIFIAATAGATAVTVVVLVTAFSIANVFVFRITPAVLGYQGFMNLYNHVNSSANEDVISTTITFLCLLYAHLALACGRKRLSHNHQAMHALLFAVASYKIMNTSNDPVGTFLGFDFTIRYIKDHMAVMGTVLGTVCGTVAMVGHLASPHIDHVISHKGCSGRAKHVIN